MPRERRVERQSGQDAERYSRLVDILACGKQIEPAGVPIRDRVTDDEDARSLVVNGNVARRVTWRRNDCQIHDPVAGPNRYDRARRGDVRDVRGSREDIASAACSRALGNVIQ
jgi:hypothetical protein